MSRLSACVVVLFAATSAYADQPKPPETFTVRSILGITPSADQKRIGESGAWHDAFNKCHEPGKPPLRASEPRFVTSKEKTNAGMVDVVTLEIDFQCGLPPPAPKK